MLQLNEAFPYVSIEYIKQAIKADGHGDWSAVEADKSLSVCVVNTLKKMCPGSVVERRKQSRGPEERSAEEHQGCEKHHRLTQRSWLPDLCRIYGHIAVFFRWKFFGWCQQCMNPERGCLLCISPGRRRGVIGGALACAGKYDWRDVNMVLTIQASCRPEDTGCSKRTPPRACNNMTTAESCQRTCS